jgi:hypothetical protein
MGAEGGLGSKKKKGTEASAQLQARIWTLSANDMTDPIPPNPLDPTPGKPLRIQ